MQNQPKYYYDYHLPPEDLLTGWEYPNQSLYTLLGMLKWLYREQPCFIARKLNFYLTDNPNEIPLSPDLAIFKGLEISEEAQRDLRHWSPTAGLPTPDLVFEFTAKPRPQWQHTLTKKPLLYQALAVKELFAYDGLHSWEGENTLIRGWRYEGEQIVPLKPDDKGRLWSVELQSWILGTSNYVLLYDQQNKARPTEFQAQQAALGERWAVNGLRLDGDDEDDED